MSFPGPGRGRGRGSDSANNNHVVMSAGRGAVLVAVAVIAGLLVLAVIRDSKSTGEASQSPEATLPVVTTVGVPTTNPDGTPAATTATTAAGTTATTKPKKTTSTTTKGGSNARPNDQVVVQVLNGSGIPNAASTRSNDLKARGYQTASAGNAPAQRTGTAVQCKAGYDKEADKLVSELAAIGVTAVVEPIADPLPTQFDPIANCYVILGK
jgi:hypothetical protein